MYYPQQSPGIPHKLANHHDPTWRLPQMLVQQQPGQQQPVGPPPPSPGYALYTNGGIPHHPAHHQLQHPQQLQHHHQNSLSHYPSPPNQHTHQQHLLAPQGSPAAATPIVSAQWQHQLMKCELVRASRTPHHRARASAMASRTVTKSAITITNPNKSTPTPEQQQQQSSDGGGSPDSSPSNGGGTINHPPSTVGPVSVAPRPTGIKPPENTWTSLDMGGINIKTLPPTSGLFTFTFLINLYLNHNSLATVPPEIAKLRHLELLDLSGNSLSSLPPELGMLTQLKEFYLFDNHLNTIPPQYGTLHQLQTLGIEGNPLDPALKNLVQKDGTQALISYLRDSCPVTDAPPERVWKYLIPPQEFEALVKDPNTETATVICYNILCEKYATERIYGYTPSWALAWAYRKGRILDELLKHNSDFMCLQEVDQAQYEDYFIVHLRQSGYEGVYHQKSRSKNLNESDKRLVDGCAIFYKADKYTLIEERLMEFNQMAMQRQDFKKTDDMFNRVLGKDHIAVIALFETKHTGTRFVVANAHIHWDPAYRDVKLVQVALLVEEIEKMANAFAKLPPPLLPGCHSAGMSNGDDSSDGGNDGELSSSSSSPYQRKQSTSTPPLSASLPNSPTTLQRPPPIYTDGTKIPIFLCGDFNSIPGSGVYDFLSTGTLPPNHEDFMSHMYGRYTSEGIRHRIHLRSAYAGLATQELPVTNFTPGFQDHIDYVWYSERNLGVCRILSQVDRGYLDKCVGFPNAHFPSDHVAIVGEFRVKPPKESHPIRQLQPPTKQHVYQSSLQTQSQAPISTPSSSTFQKF